MSAATSAINTPRRQGNLVYLAAAAAVVIFQGTLVAKDANGRAVPAANTAGLRVVGIATETVDNAAGAAGALSINIELGIFKFENSATSPVVAATVGLFAAVEDDNTVALTATNLVAAGRVVEVDADGGVWIDTRAAYFGPKALVTLTSVNGVAAAAADNTALRAEAEKIGDDVRALHASIFG